MTQLLELKLKLKLKLSELCHGKRSAEFSRMNYRLCSQYTLGDSLQQQRILSRLDTELCSL